MNTTRVIAQYLSAKDSALPAELSSAIATIGDEIKRIFHYSLPADVEWRTSNHPDYEMDSKEVGKHEAMGFVSRDHKKIYLNLEKKPSYTEFVAHEIGHFLDWHLGVGKYFSHTVITPPLKDSPHEAFAQMIDYVVNDSKTGGPGQTALYKATCEKLKIKPTL